MSHPSKALDPAIDRLMSRSSAAAFIDPLDSMIAENFPDFMLAVAAEHELEAIMMPGCRSNPRMAHCVGQHLRGIPRSNALPPPVRQRSSF